MTSPLDAYTPTFLNIRQAEMATTEQVDEDAPMSPVAPISDRARLAFQRLGIL